MKMLKLGGQVFRLVAVLTLIGGALSARSAVSSSQGSQAASATAQVPAVAESQPCPQGLEQTSQAQFRDYLIRTYRTDADSCLVVIKGGVPVYSRHESAGVAFEIVNNSGGDPGIPLGTDLTGEGKPDLIVMEWSGGAHCCFTYDLFELGPKFREIAQIEADHSDSAQFVDLNHDGRYEFVGNDWSFAYWKSSFAESPSPQVILQYRRGRYELAANLMRTPKPSPQTLAAAANTVRSDMAWGPVGAPDCEQDCGIPVSLWREMLDLMYGGHPDLAWRVLNETWHPERSDKTEFVAQFCKRLTASRYWPQLKDLTGPCPPAGKP